jgi:AcrR family transcriptional regulator
VSTDPRASGGRARRGRPPAQSSEDTYRRILTAARRCFSRQGYERTAIADIAAEAGVTPRALYHYVESKRELFTAAAEAALVRFAGEVAERVLVHESAIERLRAYIDVFRVMHREDPSLVAFVSLSALEARWNPDLPDPLTDMGEMVKAANRHLIDGAVERGELMDGVDPAGAVALLQVFGAGLTMVAGSDEDEAYPAMLDVLERLLDSRLFARPGESGGPV